MAEKEKPGVTRTPGCKLDSLRGFGSLLRNFGHIWYFLLFLATNQDEGANDRDQGEQS